MRGIIGGKTSSLEVLSDKTDHIRVSRKIDSW